MKKVAIFLILLFLMCSPRIQTNRIPQVSIEEYEATRREMSKIYIYIGRYGEETKYEVLYPEEKFVLNKAFYHGESVITYAYSQTTSFILTVGKKHLVSRFNRRKEIHSFCKSI